MGMAKRTRDVMTGPRIRLLSMDRSPLSLRKKYINIRNLL